MVFTAPTRTGSVIPVFNCVDWEVIMIGIWGLIAFTGIAALWIMFS